MKLATRRGGEETPASVDGSTPRKKYGQRTGRWRSRYLNKMAQYVNSNFSASRGCQLASAGARPQIGRLLAGTILLVAGLLQTGCAVTQPRGDGKLERHQEATTQRGYYLYLPKDYAGANDAARKARRWPLVVTFHGMKPFDNSLPQALEWEAEADRYGYLVLAPDLEAPDMLAQFPVRTLAPGFKSDEDATLKILDEVLANTCADPHNVLSTSWSSGGYLAHYMLNRHPDKFTCLAVRQSNFSAAVLDGALTARSQSAPVLIINTENDFGVCLRESAEGVEWYKSHGYHNFGWVRLRGGGHERTPDLAADFFGRIAGIQPLHPPRVLIQRQAMDGNAVGLALLSGKPINAPPAPAVAVRNTTRDTGRNDLLFASSPAGAPTPARTGTEAPARPGRSGETPPARDAAAVTTPRRSQVAIRVSSAIGIEPLNLNYSAECPTDWFNSADFVWTLNGALIGRGVNGAKVLTESGDYTLGLAVVTRSGDEYRSSRLIRVVPRSTANEPPALGQ